MKLGKSRMPWNSPVRNRLRILVSWRAKKKSRRRIDENKRQIVANGVPGDDPGVLGLKQIPKMLQPRPVPLDDALKQALGEIDVLEGHRQPKQGEDVVDEKVQKPWGHHQIQRPQPPPAGPPSLCGCHGSRSLSAADCRGPGRSEPRAAVISMPASCPAGPAFPPRWRRCPPLSAAG